MPRPPLTLTKDRLTLKLVCESHLRWGTFIPNLGTLGLWFSNYLLCTQTKAMFIAPFLMGGGIIVCNKNEIARATSNPRHWRKLHEGEG